MATDKVRKNNGIRYVPFDMSQHKTATFDRYFVIIFENDTKRRINPFRAYKEIETMVGGKVMDMISMSRNFLLVTVNNKQQGEALAKMVKLDGKYCRVEPHRTLNTCKGLVYISEFDISEEGLSDQNVLYGTGGNVD